MYPNTKPPKTILEGFVILFVKLNYDNSFTVSSKALSGSYPKFLSEYEDLLKKHENQIYIH